jgi:hypothetical protein
VNLARSDTHLRSARAAAAVAALSNSTPPLREPVQVVDEPLRRFHDIDAALAAASSAESMLGAVVDLPAVVSALARAPQSRAMYERFLRREPIPVAWVLEETRELPSAAPIAAFLLTDDGWSTYGHQLRNWTVGTLMDRMPGLGSTRQAWLIDVTGLASATALVDLTPDERGRLARGMERFFPHGGNQRLDLILQSERRRRS